MPRKLRNNPGGLVYHVTNRTWDKLKLFENESDYEIFEGVLAEAAEREKTIRICSYCLMPDHFHLVVWPGSNGQLSRLMQWMSMTYTQRWHSKHPKSKRGNLFQSRYKSYVVQQDAHFASVCRYVEANAARAKLVQQAQKWRWSSLWVRENQQEPMAAALAEWPARMPSSWLARVNKPQEEKELAALRCARDRGRPYGDDRWVKTIAKRLDLESSLRPIGRPRKVKTVVRKKRLGTGSK